MNFRNFFYSNDGGASWTGLHIGGPADKSYKVTAYMMEPHRSMHQWMHVTNVKVDANGVLYFTHYGKRVVLKNDNFLVEDDYRGEE